MDQEIALNTVSIFSECSFYGADFELHGNVFSFKSKKLTFSLDFSVEGLVKMYSSFVRWNTRSLEM